MAFGGGFVEKRHGKEGRRRMARKDRVFRMTKIRNPRATHKAQNPYYDAMFFM